MLPPAIVIHSLAHARQALAPSLPVTLLSAPGAPSYAGALWWRALINAAQRPHPDIPILDVIDCADAPGRALEALALRCPIVILYPCPAWPSVADRAAQSAATLLSSRPEALDLAQPGAHRHIAAWLAPR